MDMKEMKTLAIFDEDGHVIETVRFSDTDVMLTVRGVGIIIAGALTPSDDIWNLAAQAATVRSKRKSEDATPAQRIQDNIVRLLTKTPKNDE